MKSSKNCRTSSFQVFPGSLRTQRYFLISKTFCLIFYQFVERCFPNNYSILLRVQGSRDTSRSLSCDSGRSSLCTQLNFITQISALWWKFVCHQLEIHIFSVLIWMLYRLGSVKGDDIILTNLRVPPPILFPTLLHGNHPETPQRPPRESPENVWRISHIFIRWLEDPFLGDIIHQDGHDYIFGRGAIDDKHSVVGFLGARQF